jgi:hypothetical protein
MTFDSRRQEIGVGSGELVAADEPSVVAESLFDTIVMEDGEADGSLSDSTGADESDGGEVFGETNDLVDHVVASEAGSWCWGR